MKEELAGNKSMPDYLKLCYEEPLLSPDQEKHLFRRYNFHKFRALIAYEDGDLLEACREIKSADKMRKQITSANIRCAVGFLKKNQYSRNHEDMVSEALCMVIRAIDYFDWTRGLKFSTYLTWCLARSIRRIIGEAAKHDTRFVSSTDLADFDHYVGKNSGYEDENRIEGLRSLVVDLMGHCDERQQLILTRRFFEDKTLQQVGDELGVTKERIRQIETVALRKIQEICSERNWNLETIG